MNCDYYGSYRSFEGDFSFFVHSFYFWLVGFPCFEADQLEGICHDLLVYKRIWFQVNVLGQLEAIQSSLLGKFIDLNQEKLLYLRILAELLVLSLDTLPLRQQLQLFFIGNYNGNSKVLMRIPMQKHLRHHPRLHIYIFNPIWS